MTNAIHPSAIVEDGARLGAGVEIGPFCHVGPQATLGDGVRLISHVSLAGDTTVGARTIIYPFASIGHPPQDLKYRGEPVRLSIGEDCIIREGVTMNPGTAGGGSETIVGPRSVFLANAHVAHDCRIGEGVILSNNVMLAGHCQIGDFAILSGGGRRRISSSASALTRSSAVSPASSTTSSPSALRSATAPGSPASMSSASSAGVSRTRRSTSSGAPTRCCSTAAALGGTLKERVDEVAEAFAGQEAVQADRRLSAPGRRPRDLRPARRKGRGGVSGATAGRALAPRLLWPSCAARALFRSRSPARRAASGVSRFWSESSARPIRRSKPIRMSGSAWARSASCSPP